MNIVSFLVTKHEATRRTRDGEAPFWRERGADIDQEQIATERKGFGSVVLERMLGMALQAELERHMRPDGIEWLVWIPLSQLKGEGEQGSGDAISGA